MTPGRATGGRARNGAPIRSAAGVKDVAAAAGVSLGTVSNVLNRPELVAPTTRAKVEQAMDRARVRPQRVRPPTARRQQPRSWPT